jgi:hypothetical protein
MTITAPPTVDNLPEPPNPADRLTFNSKAYPWSLALGDMTTEMNNIAAWNYNTAIETQTNANSAQASASNAAAAASAAALNAPGTMTTTTETITFGTGSKTFQVPTGKSYVAGQYVLVAQTSAPSNYMVGQVTSYNTVTGVLILNVVTNTGSGSASAWTFSLTSPPSNQLIYAAADKATPVDADVFGYLDSAASFVFKKFTWANIKSLFVGKTGNQSMTGALTVGSTVLVGPSGMGYASGLGAGGAVTQPTSKATAVTLNKPSGAITTHNAGLAGNTAIAFTVTNSFVSNTDTVVCNVVGGTGDVNAYIATAFPYAGGFYISLRNMTATNLTDSVKIQFNVVKGAAS